MDRTWMKKCCEHCPFKRDTPLTLHPERAEGFAYMAQNRYSDFPCHKTADYQEETDFRDGGYVHGKHSFTCHGFKGMQIEETGEDVQGFVSDREHFQEAYEMIDYHTEAHEQRLARRSTP